jgi:hypothetical protein
LKNGEKMNKIEELKLPEQFKQWDHAPEWFETPDLELSGPFWSIMVQPSNDEPGQYDLIVTCAQGDIVYRSIATDVEIAKNKATLLYNQIIQDLKEAVSGNEPN